MSLVSSNGFKNVVVDMPRYRTKKVNLVLISGKAGVGKTTVAYLLKSKLETSFSNIKVEHTALAKPIKEIAYEVFKWDGNKDGKGRRLLQVIGTEAGREYNENIWVEYLDDNLLNGFFPPNMVLVDDCRFPNEISFFTDNFLYDVTTIRVESDRSKLPENQSEHASETSLPSAEIENLEYYPAPDFKYNFSIFNNGTIEDLNNKLDGVISYLSTKVITY